MRTGPLTVILATGILLGCAHDPGEEEGYPLTVSMDARVLGDSVHLSLHVTNISTDPVALEFPSSQQYDFVVRGEDGATVWSWSAARSFAQVLTADTVAPGATRSYTEVWGPDAMTGDYVAEGRLLATDHPAVLAIPIPLDDTGS